MIANGDVTMTSYHVQSDQDVSPDGRSEESGAVLLKTNQFSKKKICGVATLRFLYYFSHILLALTFFTSAIQPCCVADDIKRYREDESMVTVKLEGHRPLSFFVRCAGTGNKTVLFENGLGGMVHMGWTFIPSNLSQTYRVCAYDRRGYGWSEGFEHDYNGMQQVEPQWAGSNVDFLEKLVTAAGIPTPFYYVGHSYGGYHMNILSLKRPDFIKGLVFLDSARFSPLRTLRSLMEITANIQASGALRVAIDTNILNYKSLFRSVVDFDSLSKKDEQILMAIFKSGNFFATYTREAWPLTKTNYASSRLHQALFGKKIDKPVLVIDAGDRRNSNWFPGEYFPRYNNSTCLQVVNGTDHQTLIYSAEYAWKTKDLIQSFIEQT